MASATGIAIGRASATIAQVSKRGGSIALDRYLYFSLADLKKEGIDVERPDRVVAALATRMRARRFRPGEIALGVSGRDAIIRYSHLPPMPAWRLKLVMQYGIADVSEKSGAPLSADYRPLGVGKEGTVVLVAMAKDERVHEWVAAFEAARIEVGSASPLPVALSNSFRFLGENADEGMTLVLDVGRSSTEVAFVEDGALSFARSVAAGGELLTERLMKELDLERDDAEAVKLEGKGPDGEDLEDMLGPGLQQLSSLVRASVEFARQQLKVDGIYVNRVAVSGGAARTPGLVEALGRAANAAAVIFDPIASIDTTGLPEGDREDAAAHPHEAAAAIGLALGRVLPSAIELDLLPNATKTSRTFRHRTIWMRLAAAVLLVSVLGGLGAAWWRLSGERRLAAELKKSRVEVDRRLDGLTKLEDDNAARARAIGVVIGRSRPGYHLSSLLASLAREMPARASVLEVSLERDKDTGAFRFEIRGQADNAQRDAGETMRKLEAALSRDPEISSAKIQPTSPVEGAIVDWRLTVVPNVPLNATAPASTEGKGS